MSVFRSLSLLAALFGATPAFAASYAVDASHTQVGFAITHMMVSTVRGSFGTVSGNVEYDPKNVAATKIDATIGVTSVDTNESKRDDHLRSPDFFDVAQFPEMKFVSTGVKNVKKDSFELLGNLTIRGVTKPVTLTVKTFAPEAKDPWGGTRTGTRATGTINRQDFGLTWNKALDGGGYIVGDEVEIALDVELVRK